MSGPLLTQEGKRQMSDTVSLKSCASREEAEFLKTLLESNGIRAIVLADDYVGLPLLVSGGVQLQVLEEDVQRARQILEEAEKKN
jgi:Putative prokaryotic signal transducing protein